MRVGIIGGGQLGWMLIEYGIKKVLAEVDIKLIEVLDPAGSECCCARNYPESQEPTVIITQGDLYDRQTLKALEERCDVLLCEIEHFDSMLLKAFQNVEQIRNKIIQKKCLQSANVPVMQPLMVWTRGQTLDINFAPVLKTPMGGYDGKGVFIPDRHTPPSVIDDKTLIGYDDAGKVQLAGDFEELLVEKFLDWKVEVSVIVGIDAAGQVVATYDPVEMRFRDSYPILDYCIPYVCSVELQQRLIDVAKKAAQAFHCRTAAVYAVEMFVAKDNNVYVNEVAPRVHNSGHHTIDTYNVSQFELAVRLALNLSIPTLQQKFSRFKMQNLIGITGVWSVNGEYQIRWKGNTMMSPEVSHVTHFRLYDYNKGQCKSHRKLGHLLFATNADDKTLQVPHPLTKYVDLVQKTKPAPVVGIIMGSKSDDNVMSDAELILNELSVPYEKIIVSAHRTPDRLRYYAESAAHRGIRVIIAGAGGAAHLPGMVASFATTVPVIGVPIVQEKSPNNFGGIDPMMSIVQMPKGVPVACVALNGAFNAGLLAAQMLPEFKEAVQKFRTKQTLSVLY